MELIANKVIDKMVWNQVISLEDGEIYKYVFITRVEQILTFSIMLIIAAICNVLLPTILFLGIFFGIRKRAGGYHAGGFRQCFVGTLGIYIFFLIVVLPTLLMSLPVTIMIMLLSSAILIMVAAVNHPNIGWDNKAFKMEKQLAREMTILETLIVLAIVALGGSHIYIVFMSFGIILNASLVVIAKLIKQEVKENE